jgi:hypothetical protein
VSKADVQASLAKLEDATDRWLYTSRHALGMTRKQSDVVNVLVSNSSLTAILAKCVLFGLAEVRRRFCNRHAC